MGTEKKKIYYTMGEVAEMFDVNPSLIRHWESKFDILKPRKNNRGNRLFSAKDVDSLKLIYHLVKEKGMTLAGAQKRIKENPDGVSRDMEVIDRLLGIRAILLELRQELGMDREEVYRGDTAVEENVMSESARPAAGLPHAPTGNSLPERTGDGLPEHAAADLPESTGDGLPEHAAADLPERTIADSLPNHAAGSPYPAYSGNTDDGDLFAGYAAPDPSVSVLADEESAVPRIMEQTLF